PAAVSAAHSRCAPAWTRPRRPELHRCALRAMLHPEAAALDDPLFHWVSAATHPAPHTSQAACTRATACLNVRATAQEALPSVWCAVDHSRARTGLACSR